MTTFFEMERKKGETLEEFRERLADAYKKDRDRMTNEFTEMLREKGESLNDKPKKIRRR